MNNADLATRILAGTAKFSMKHYTDLRGTKCYKNCFVNPWTRHDFGHRRLMRRNGMHCAASTSSAGSLVSAFVHKISSGKARQLGPEANLTTIDKALHEIFVELISLGDVYDIAMNKHYRAFMVAHAAEYRVPLDIAMIRPDVARSMLFAHPTGRVVRLSESPGVCETASGELLPLVPMRPAHFGHDWVALSTWWPIAFDFDMILPTFQRAS